MGSSRGVEVIFGMLCAGLAAIIASMAGHQYLNARRFAASHQFQVRTASPLPQPGRLAIRNLAGFDNLGAQVGVRRPQPSDEFVAFGISANSIAGDVAFWNQVAAEFETLPGDHRPTLVGYCDSADCGHRAAQIRPQFTVITYAEVANMVVMDSLSRSGAAIFADARGNDRATFTWRGHDSKEIADAIIGAR